MKKPVCSRTLCSTGLRWLWLAVVVLVLDIISKQLILAYYGLHESTSLIPFFNLTYVRNYGAAFSFLASQGGWQRWFFTAVAIGISVTLMVMMYRNSARNKISNIAYALIIGGAIGNLIDRLMHGFVVDYIDFYVGDWHWPTFNLADSWIIIGAGLIIIESFMPDGKQRGKPDTTPEDRAPSEK